MRHFIKVIALPLLFSLCSCDNSRKKGTSDEQIPKALQEKSYTDVQISKRSYEDIIQSLYNEAVEKTPELKALEQQIDNFRKDKIDSLAAFGKYNMKNSEYYKVASSYVRSIQDSVLKIKLREQINNSQNIYNQKILKYKILLKTIDEKNISIEDLHTVLKLTRTLPFIEKYQTSNAPSIIPLEWLVKKSDQLIQQTDTLLKNN